MTTTFAEKLLAKAQELEEQAKALRVAAAVMNGHQLATKQSTIASTVAAASKLRRQQAPASGNGHAPIEGAKERVERTRAAVVESLQSGPQTAIAVTAYVQSLGLRVLHARVLQILRESGARKLGKGSQTRWELPGASEAPTHAEPALSPYKALQAQRAAKVEQILDILQQHGAPMRTRDLTAAARARGIQSLTGIVGLVRNGTLATRGRGAKRTYRLAT